jgi:DNA polymerase III subunit delta
MVGASYARSPVIIFVGEDKYLKEKALKELSSSLLGDPPAGLDHKVFHGADAEIKEVLDYVNTVPFLADKRLAVIKDAENMPAELTAAILEYIKKPSKSTCLVLEVAGNAALKEYDEVIRQVSVRRFGKPADGDLLSWIRDFITARGKEIEANAAVILKELQGQDLLSLTQEMEKLVAYAGQRKKITVADVEEMVGRSLALSAFDITRAIDEKKVNDALRICSDLIKSGRKEHEIIGLLCWHLRRALKAKVMQARGNTDYQVALALRIGQRYQGEFFRQISGLKMSQVRSRIGMLLEADLDIKRSKIDPGLALEFAVIRLCLS